MNQVYIALGAICVLMVLAAMGWLLGKFGWLKSPESKKSPQVVRRDLPQSLAIPKVQETASQPISPIVRKVVPPSAPKIEAAISGQASADISTAKSPSSTQKKAAEFHSVGGHTLADDGKTRSGRMRFGVDIPLTLPLAALGVGEPAPGDISAVANGQLKLLKKENDLWTQADEDLLKKMGSLTVQAKCSSEGQIKKVFRDKVEMVLRSSDVKLEEKARVLYSAANHCVADVFANPSSKASFHASVGTVKHCVNYLNQDKSALKQMFEISSPKLTEPFHAVHVTTYSVAIARRIGYTKTSDLEALGIGAMLHDIGKTKIDAKILEKPSALTDEERFEVQKHVEYGYEIARDNRQLVPELSATIIRQHHARRSGDGYPKKGDQLHLFSRIVAFVEFFDVLTLDRPYAPAMETSEAIKFIVASSKTEFDRNLYVQLVNALGHT